MTIFDCPGFADSRGGDYDIINAHSISLMTKFAK